MRKKVLKTKDCLDYVGEAAFMGAHSCGTCRMGIDDDAILDPELQVRGISDLRVLDASIISTFPNGNTNALTLMITEKASAKILHA